MTFLAPMAALAAAAITAPILLILYMLRLRRRPVRVSTIMFWPVAAEDAQANEPLRWLRPSWLLFLHAAVLALLLLALARPAVMGPGAADRLVILIDRSASMSAADMPDGKTRLDAAKARAARLIEDLLS